MSGLLGFKTRVVVLCAAAAVLAACGSSSASGGSNAGLSPDAVAGKKFAAEQCGSCHSTNGAGGVGPTWKNLSGSTVKLTNGQSVVADDAYLTESIDDPDAQIVAGYHAGVMSEAFPKGSLDATQTRQLVAYIDSLK